MCTMILMIDNYDSFTYNLYQLIGKYQPNIEVVRNDCIELYEINELNPSQIIISPGPGNPNNDKDFGVCKTIISNMKNTPILGICLGHQGIYSSFNGKIKKTKPLHGKYDTIVHKENELFKDIPKKFTAVRYHSLICDETKIPEDIEITATTKNNEIMAIKHKKYPIYGIQFHPESIGTKYSDKLIENFLEVKV